MYKKLKRKFNKGILFLKAKNAANLRFQAIKAANNAYLYASNEQAHLALYNIELHNGKLSNNLRKKADDYAIEVLGNKEYSKWLYVYSVLRKTFIEGWIPDNYYGLVVNPLINGKYRGLSNAKTFTNLILKSSAIPDSAYLINGVFYSDDFVPIEEENIHGKVFQDQSTVFFKSNNSNQGLGVEKLTSKNFDISKYKSQKDGCFQLIIKPHDFFLGMSKNSTPTIRITTARDNFGEVSVRAAYLRIGRSSEDIVKSKSAIKIPIDFKNGILGDIGFMPDYRFVEKHPDSGFYFSGKKIPFFDKALELVIYLHKSFPHFSCIGWDTCIDNNDEVKIMEWNASNNSIGFSEALSGPCFLGFGWENLWHNYNRQKKLELF